MRWSAEESPDEARVCPWDWGRDVCGRVAETDGEDLCFCRDVGERGTEGEDAAAVGGGAFGEDGDWSVWVFLEEFCDGVESGVGGWCHSRG